MLTLIYATQRHNQRCMNYHTKPIHSYLLYYGLAIIAALLQVISLLGTYIIMFLYCEQLIKQVRVKTPRHQQLHWFTPISLTN